MMVVTHSTHWMMRGCCWRVVSACAMTAPVGHADRRNLSVSHSANSTLQEPQDGVQRHHQRGQQAAGATCTRQPSDEPAVDIARRLHRPCTHI